jgi:cobalamin biosynthesis Mg chelatase CobN
MFRRFIGSGMFCIKMCNPAGNNNAGYCQHTLDRIGLGYNCPSKYTVGAGMQPGDFEVCDTVDMTVPGEYTDASGATQSYAQPPESAGPITTIPFQPTTVASSNCKPTASSLLFSDLVPATSTGSGSAAPTASGSSGAASGTASGSGAQTTGKATATGSGTAKPTGTTSSGSSASGSGAAQSSSTAKSGASHVAVVGTAFSIVAAGAAFVAFI